jgi:hypothetical protein
MLPRMRVWTIVERCDACERFPNDLSAAAVVFHDVKWVQCAAGGWHAVGRNPPAVVKKKRKRAQRRSSTVKHR